MAHRPDYESADYKEGYEDGKREASKQWVGLSDEEIDNIYCEVSDNCVNYFPSELYAAWFKALREKNG